MRLLTRRAPTLHDASTRRLRPHHQPRRLFSLKRPDEVPFDNVPAAPTPLLGRALELTAAGAALRRDDVRLLTLSGPGGSGKTRLSLELARALREHFRDGALFVDLSAVVDAELVVPAIARAIGVRPLAGETPLDGVKRRLKSAALLLLLDNLEQVVDAAAEVAEILTECPDVKVLATSREPLRLRWERVFPVMPLDVPDERDLDQPETIAATPAVRLFVQRAEAIRPGFALDADSARSVAQICLQLDGLPLAIELAAAHVSVLSPAQILERLRSPLELLTLGAQDLPSRQRTLRRAIGWSYELLSEDERRVAERLSAFAGSFSLAGAEAVCDGLRLPVLSGLGALVDKNLVRRDDADSPAPRFRMLATIREFLRERLVEQGGEEAARRAHAAHMLEVAEEAGPALLGGEQAEWLERLDRELPDLRGALDWALTSTEGGLGLRLAGALWKFWEVHGHIAEGRSRLAALLALPGAGPLPRATGLQAAGHLAFLQADYADARARLEEGLGLRRRLDDAAGIAAALNGLGLVATYEGDYEAAWSLLQEAVAANRAAGARAGEATNLNNLGRVAYYKGELATARALQTESAALRVELADDWSLSLSRADLADVALAEGSLDEAEALLVESLSRWVELGSQWGVAYSLEGLAGAAAGRGLPTRTIRLIATAAALRAALGEPPSAVRQRQLTRLLTEARRRIGEAGFEAAWGAGQASTVEEAIAYMPDAAEEPVAERAKEDGPLSPRESEVARLVARGYTNRQIAAELIISERTADAHVARILSKLGFGSRAQVAAWVVGQKR